MHISHIRDRLKSNSIGRFLLYFLSLVYIILFEINKLIKTLSKKDKYNFVFVCVGNISSGGTGKTTIVIEIAKKLLRSGLKVCILTRGYKSKYKKNDIIEVNYSELDSFINNEMISDEHKLISLILRDEKIPVIASKNRRLGLRFIAEKYKPDVVISDDGFQNFSFKYDYSIVVINPNQIDDKILPLGNLRESYSGIKRADAVIINHCELFDSQRIDYIEKKLSKYIKRDKIFRGFYIIDGFEDIINNKTYDKNFFSGKKIAVFSAIGDNEEFINYLVKFGAKPVKIWKYPDHYRYSEYDIISIQNLRENLPVVTTMKDAVKILSIARKIFKSGFYVTRISMMIEEKLIDEILNIR